MGPDAERGRERVAAEISGGAGDAALP